MQSYENLNKINEFRKEFMGEHYKEWTKEDLDRFLGQPQTKLLTMECMGGMGLATIHICESLTRKSLIIEDFIIDKNCRDMGWGTKFIQKIIDLAKQINADCIEVSTKTNNEISNKMYQEMGFINRNQNSYRLWLKYENRNI